MLTSRLFGITRFVTTWDEAKQRRNFQKHGVVLAIAERFDFVTAII
jgi:uncharacterized DUF497 family protein